MNRIKKIISFITLVLVLVNTTFPFILAQQVLAQEVALQEPAPVSSETPVITPAPSITPNTAEVPAASPPSATPAETINNVETGKDYTAPQNDKVKINFTKLPDTAGKLTIEEVKLSPDQVKQLKAASDTAYDITSTLTDGTFTYDLTLPLPKEAKGKKLEVKSAESKDELKEAQIVDQPKEEKEDTLTIRGLDHFTVFIITTPDPDTVQRVLINEILPNPASGAEWIELFNNGTQPINLASGTGWTLRNSAGDSQTLSSLGTIAAADSAVFNAPANWLSNTAPETITLSNELGAVVDAVTISLTSPGFAIDHYPLAGESVGRKTDGVSEWMIFTSPTKGAANTLPKAAAGFVQTGPVNPNTGFPSWYKDSNGIALDLMEAADAFGISDPVDPANPFSEQIGFNAEGFWWSAEASIDRPVGTRTILVLAVEAAFGGEAAVDGEQSVQNRVRYRIDGLVPGETYTITHPFGEVDEVADESGVINVTDDTGCFAGGGVTCNQAAAPNFSTPLSGQVGPYLTWTTFNTNPALTDPQLINPANPGRRYVGNPAIEHEVTGSPAGKNLFRVKGPNAGGPGVNSIETNLFAVSGRLADTNAPVITLFGANSVNVNQNAVYVDAGATAVDDLGGNLTGSIAVTGLPVDTATLGAKTVTYTVTDTVGRTSVATRTVNVVESSVLDTTAPVITILGANTVSVVAGTPYVDAGATALDNVDGNISANIVTTGLPVDTSAVGQFTVTYNVSDVAGNAAVPATRTVKVAADKIAPVITILGSNPVNILTGAPYGDAGATVIDNVDGDITANIVTTGLPVDTTIVRSNTVTYHVSDAAGNTTVATRIVNVAGTLPAGLAEAGPIAPAGGFMAGFPSWYKDSNGIALDLMEAADAFGISDPVDPANPFSEQIGFNAEGFWWSAEASIDRPVGTRTILVLAVEAAFGGEAAVDGEQSVQNRVRYRIDGLVPGETYTITHPFGEVDEVADESGVINVTDDTGCFAGGGVTCNQTVSPNFSTPLSGQVGPYLTWTTFNTNPALTDPQLTNPANPGRRYVGNPAIEHEVTGSPAGKNLFRVKGPDVGGAGVNSIETNLFAVSGRLADTNAPVITLIGDNPVNINQDENYEDAGATAVDNFDGNLTAGIVTSGLPVDTSTIGVKTITYTVSDRAGNTASAQRIVNVVAPNTNPPAPEPPAPVVPNPDPPVTPPILDGSSSTTDSSTPTDQKGSITIIEKSLPQDAQDFEFSRSSGGDDFTLDDDADSALANQIIMSDLSTKVYSFSQLNVPLGWVLKEITCSDPNNNSIVDLNTASVNLQLDKGEVITCTFTNIKKGSIAGNLFEDKNGNAVREAGDLAISQRTVFLDSNDNGILDSGETSIATDTLGNYQFSALMPGNYNIREVIPQSWFQTLPTSGKLAVDLIPGANLTGQDFGSTVYYSIANGGKFAPIGLTDSIRSLGESIISVLGNGGASVVSIPDGTIITRVDGSTFDTAQLSITLPLLSAVSGIDTAKFAPVSVLQWGIPNIGLAFSKPITIDLFVGQSFNGQTLNIFRSTTGSTGWTTEGLAAPQSCTVLLGICTIQTTLASFFVAAQTVPQAPASNNTNSSSTSNSSASSNSSTSVCADSKPGSAPILLSAVTSGSNQVTLTWSKALDPVSNYSIVYGLTAGNPIYGNPNVGGKETTSYVVSSLSGNTTYYFKVKAINGCNGSEYSNELSAAPGGETISNPAQGFSEGVLGIQTEKVKDDETKMEKPLNETGILGASVNGAAKGNQGIKTVPLVLSALGFLGFGYYRFFYKKNKNAS